MSTKSIQKVVVGFAHAVWAVVAFLSAALGVNILLEQFASQQLVDWLSAPLGSLWLAAVIYALAAALAVMPFLVRRLPWKDIASRLAVARHFSGKMLVWAFSGWATYFFMSVVAALLFSLVTIPGVDMQQQQEVGFQNLANWFEYVAAFLALVVVAPVFEELIFRGYLFGRVREKSGFWFSAILTSLTFAALHGQVNVGIDVFLLSIVLCYLREKFDSVWPGMVVHAFKNSLAYTLLFILPLYGIKLV